MRNLKDIILERLVLSKNKKNAEYTLFPKSKEELVSMIREEIEKKGKKCSLNHIDVSKITDMEDLFASYNGGYKLNEFDGDISGWDVSNVTNMKGMFHGSNFRDVNGSINEWDVSNVTNMEDMFAYSRPSGISFSSWDVSNVENMCAMFQGAKYFYGNGVDNWDVSNVKDMSWMFAECKDFYKSLSKWNLNKLEKCKSMFTYCTNLREDFSSWDVTNIQHEKMFYYCPVNKCKEYWPKGYTK
jgi:surface protein